jgi:hypothetical protein
MITPLRRPVQLAAVVVVAGLVGACGGSGDNDDAEVAAVIESLKSLKPGEILIQGRRAEKFSGPYRLRKGGYLFRFRRIGGDGSLTVLLESVRGSKRQPFQLLLDDSDQKAGQRTVTVSGKLYVHVKSSAKGYVLRFTPKRPRR